MPFDAHANLAISTVATAPSPATSGTSLVVASGHGARFPAVPFNATVWPADATPDPANAEIVRVTGISTDTLTIVRAQEGTSARTIVVGDYIAATMTAKTITDIETLIGTRAAPALSGALRLDNAQWLTARNAADSADLNLLRADSSDGVSLANGVVLVRSDGKIHLTTGGLGINRVPTIGLLEFEPPAVTSGDGVLLRSNGIFSANVPAATQLNGISLWAENTHTPGADGSSFNMLYLVTDTAAVDTGAAIIINNIGHSDGMWIGVRGKAGPATSAPTGIGMAHNRGAGGENSATTSGYGIQWWDHSTTNQGPGGPIGIFLKKHANLDTQHLALQIVANRGHIDLLTPEGGAYAGGNSVIELRNNSVVKFRLQANGDLLFVPTGAAVNWTMPSGNAGTIRSNASNQLEIQTGSGGLRVMDNGFTQQILGLSNAGAFTLNVGPLIVGATPATAGDIRLPKLSSIQWRNNANSADMSVLSTNTSDQIVLASTGGISYGSSITDPAVAALHFAPILSLSTNGKALISAQATIIPTAAITIAYGLSFIPTLSGTEGVTTNTVTTLNGVFSRLDTAASYDAAVSNAFCYNANGVNHLGGGTIATLAGYYSSINSGISGVTNSWQLFLVGTAPSYFGGDIWLIDRNMVLNATTGTKIGTATTQKLGFWNATPIVQPSAYTQTYATADKTHANFTSADLATTAATQTTPWGFASQAQADNIATQVNLLRADVADLKQLVNAIIDDLQAMGLAA